MKIAVASKADMISEHFGHCEDLNFYEIVDGKVLNHEFMNNSGYDCKSLPQLIKDKGMEVIIAGGIGKGAVNRCESVGLKVICGIKGSAEKAALEFEAGNLKSTGELCSHHDHHHSHGHHHHHEHGEGHKCGHKH